MKKKAQAGDFLRVYPRKYFHLAEKNGKKHHKKSDKKSINSKAQKQRQTTW